MIITVEELRAHRLAAVDRIMKRIEKEIIQANDADCRSVQTNVGVTSTEVINVVIHQLMFAGYTVTQQSIKSVLYITWK